MVGPEWFFVYLLELSCVFFIWCHIGIPWKENKFKVIFSVTICAFLMTLVDHLAFRMLLSHLISVLIIYIVFRKKLEDILIELIFVFVSLSILQTPLLLVASNLKGFDLVNPKFQFIIHIFYLIFIATLFNFIPIKKYYKICKGFFKKIYFVMLNLYVLIYIYHFILFMYGYTNFFFFISLITFFVLINIAFVQSLLSSKEEKLLIASYKEQKNTFLPLINEIKSKQHDFKNHLTTIYGLSQNESSESVQNYIETLDHSLKDIDLFFNISNKVISAILYSKTSEAKKNNIDFVVNIPPYEINFPFKDYEYASIISNLLDNAFESPFKPNQKTKMVKLIINENENNLYLEVYNNGNPIPAENLSKIFKKGFSTKTNKSDHGFGLYNVKKITTKYGGSVELLYKDDFIIFRIMFNKDKILSP